MNKHEIRKLYSEKRKKLSKEVIHEMTEAIVRHFAEINMQNIRMVLSYSPVESKKEFNTALCEKLLLEGNRDAKIAHPRIIRDSNFMEAVVINSDTLFASNDYLIREPSHGKILTPESFDMVLVPLLAFDIRGYRVGYGKGFYDRWLAQCRPDIFKVGFSFFDPTGPIDDINEFDVPLDLCITPMRVYEF